MPSSQPESAPMSPRIAYSQRLGRWPGPAFFLVSLKPISPKESPLHFVLYSVTTSRPSEKSPSAERIRAALGLVSVKMDAIPEETLGRIAELCENVFNRYPRILSRVETYSRMRLHGCYFERRGLIRIKPGMDPDRTVFIFAHEFGHAILASINTAPHMKTQWMATVRTVRGENLRRFAEFFWSIRFDDHQKAFFVWDDFLQNRKEANYFERKIRDYRAQPDFQSKPVTVATVRAMARKLEYHRGLIPQPTFDALPSILVSEYSLTKPMEYFCEHFADFVCGSSNPFSARIGEWVRDHCRQQMQSPSIFAPQKMARSPSPSSLDLCRNQLLEILHQRLTAGLPSGYQNE